MAAFLPTPKGGGFLPFFGEVDNDKMYLLKRFQIDISCGFTRSLIVEATGYSLKTRTQT